MQCDLGYCNSFATLSYHIRNSCVTRVSQNHTDVKRFRGCFEEKIQIFLKNSVLLSQLKRNKESENVTVVLHFFSKSAECNRHRTLLGTFWCAPVCKMCIRDRLIAARTASDVTRRCLQLFGGYGYTRDYPIERMMRDAKITEIYEGTSEVQMMVISGALLK